MRIGDMVTTRSGERWRVERVLGEGSQGRVLRIASVDRPGRLAALKRYEARTYDAWQATAIERLVERGSPGPMFLWPREVVTFADGSFGYVMPLMPTGFVSLSTLLRGELDIRPSTALRIAVGLAHGFLQLHALGFCYRDISFGNVLAHPVTAQVLICDNDNVGVDGASRTAVLGTRRFMAPEVVRGEAVPSTQTDLHALAVLIFSVLMVQHPLLGRRELDYPCLDQSAERALFGDSPVFIFDPDDRSNAPDPDEHPGVAANWQLHPAGIRHLFVEAFCDGLRRPSRRVRESVWRGELARALDMTATCPTCGSENFYDGPPCHCWSCQSVITSPPVLRLPRATLVLSDNACVYRHHLARDFDVSEVVGRVVRHPRTARWGLRNESTTTWAVRLEDRLDEVPPGRTAALVEGATLDLGPATATIGRA